ncbi:hypothetical protein Tsubulata_018524 [Turnera subulata]|uniref:BHLH domain-containing protein n=1 Tax=Turnera subulata TaxID=218843 RepID=A0A9Q0GG54_9ROSI|nr:hypothetical protein Tsubulata_018524 [Turnera subulata]
MEPNSLSSSSDFGGLGDGFLKDSGFHAKARSGLSSSSSLVLDSERGELVEANVRVEKKGVSAERSITALRNHSEAERKRRARINAHLDNLRSLVPGTAKMDKASLLAEVIGHLKELQKSAAEASEGLLMPMDVDEVSVERQEDRLDGAPCLIKASLCCDFRPGLLSDLRQTLDALHLIVMRAEIVTLQDRMKNVFMVTSCKEEDGENGEAHELLIDSIHQALRSVLDKFSASQEFSLKSTLSNKRRRVALFDPYLSSSSGDVW